MYPTTFGYSCILFVSSYSPKVHTLCMVFLCSTPDQKTFLVVVKQKVEKRKQKKRDYDSRSSAKRKKRTGNFPVHHILSMPNSIRRCKHYAAISYICILMSNYLYSRSFSFHNQKKNNSSDESDITESTESIML